MLQEKIRWLIDQDLPSLSGEGSDTVHLSECGRDALWEALKDGRAVVTCNRYLMDCRTIPFNCPPIVVVSDGQCTEEGLQRNLLHLEFCLQHRQENMSWEGQRFMIDLDRSIYKMNTKGGLEEIETWKVPSVRGVLAWGAST